jgi:hypothetical protein
VPVDEPAEYETDEELLEYALSFLGLALPG